MYPGLYAFGGIIVVGIIVVLIGFAIGTFFALPMIWFHIGAVSRKLSIIINLLEKKQT
ncbi:MAG: hypothetical protein PHS93_07165 [Candidatus Omnitrophica bacterium]|nr:hypothetical protein [Candidatus Omnitrophota bacterium]MDD5352921.1 hypothetical protein [Candidatus Omnitrophota bacterium]MDD5550520.1 hypothetical protein [Candidatus Omnitrophota bacterium]